jgi:dTDP-4-dehydrorhamnose 3,5-epimerase
MIIHELPLAGAALVAAQPFSDDRGVFSRFFCSRELAPLIGPREIVNVNFSRTSRKGSLRGLHFQRAPHREMKLVRCLRGSVYDVIVDLRRESATFLQWHGEILSAENHLMLVVPEGFAHGFQALDDESELLYLTTAFYEAGAEGGVRYDDPALSLAWPLPVADISGKDAGHPLLGDAPDPLGGA